MNNVISVNFTPICTEDGEFGKNPCGICRDCEKLRQTIADVGLQFARAWCPSDEEAIAAIKKALEIFDENTAASRAARAK